MVPLEGERVLITGGLGACGWQLTCSLAEQLGCDVTVLDDYSNATPPSYVPPGVTIVEGDVREESVFAPLVREHPWVFHLACRTIVTGGSDPETDLAVNGLSTRRLLEFIRRERPAGFQRFIYTSSASIYGNCRHLPADELDPPDILSHYAASKMLGEHYTLLYYTAYDIPTVCVRYSNVYGPRQTTRNPHCAVIGKFMDAAASGVPLTVHGDGEQTRDYTYVGDAVEATILAAVSPKATGGLFNIGTGIETSVNTLASEINSLFGNVSEIQHIDRRDVDNIRRRSVNPEKMHIRLGWMPQVSLRDGLRRIKQSRVPLGETTPEHRG
ncbi:MAG TPA: NAD-dependent epimerase/dehydratase family protein [Gemmatimonadaceae bacterium]|jgi:UDP-glucose 4-epimerase|nr:NAD-dependent epimerase/dehydratase family protein [Gemmatimonadaceae bacterium]